ncbi:MAG: hypothetical protein WDA27_13990 [Actinomycetota bacterium]
MATHGERLLAQAEARAKARGERKRRSLLLAPATAATLWALADLVAARHSRLSMLHAGVLRYVFDHTQVIAWTIALVVVPLAISVKRHPIPGGAALTLLAGPIATPLVFGHGGWKAWQTGIVILACTLILAGARARARARTARGT